MRLHKPDTMSLFPRTARLGPEGHGCALSVYACFPLREEDRQTLLGEGPMWEALMAALEPEEIFDEGYAKPRAEFLLYGACHPPKDAQAMEVGVQVGDKKKRLQIFGERLFDGKKAMPPRPLRPVPLDWKHAYGGPDHADNPLGMGHGELATGAFLPQIMRLQDHVDDLQHAVADCFRAMPPQWPQRAHHLGPFDADWLANDWPELPASSDREFFCTAPEDQRLQGYFRGDEELELEGVHPKRPHILCALPGLRPRLFVTRRDRPDELEEVQAEADTLWLFPEQELGVLCYRGVVRVADDEAGDLHSFVGDWEFMDHEPLPLEHYAAMLRSEAEEQAEEGEQDAEPPSPEPPQSEDSPEAGAAAPKFNLAPLEALAAELGRAAQELMAGKGVTPGEAETLLSRLDAEAAAPLQGDFNPQGFLAELESGLQQIMAARGLNAQDLERLLRDAATPLQQENLGAWYDTMAAMPQATPQMREAAAQGKEALAEFQAAMRQFEQLIPQGAAPEPEAPGHTIQEDTGSEETPSTPIPPGLDFRGRDLRKASFANASLDGADFSGADLAGANFQGAQLRGACLEKASCLGADFEGCIATDANFNEADLRSCHFRYADLNNASFRSALLDDVRLAFAHLQKADMYMAKAHETYGVGADFSEADLSGADFSDSLLSTADFSNCTARQTLFLGAMLDETSFYGAKARGIRFRGACLHGMRADADTDFSKADCRLADCCRVRWQGANLAHANLWGAKLDDASLEQVVLKYGVLKAVSAMHANFSKASLHAANLRHANFFRAAFRKANLKDTRIEHASLFGADLYGARIGGAVLDNANLKRTLLDTEKLHGK